MHAQWAIIQVTASPIQAHASRSKVKGMLHLNPNHNGIPPDCIKSGILDENGTAPVGLDLCKDSNKIMSEPGKFRCLWKVSITGLLLRATILVDRWLRPCGTGLSPSMVWAIWLRIGCVFDPVRRGRLAAKWKARECSRERSGV